MNSRNLYSTVYSKLFSQYICVHLNVREDFPRKETILFYPFPPAQLSPVLPLSHFSFFLTRSSTNSPWVLSSLLSTLLSSLRHLFLKSLPRSQSVNQPTNQPSSDSNKPVRSTKVRVARVTPVSPTIGHPPAVRDKHLHTCHITTVGLINSSHNKCHKRTLVTPTTPAPA